MSDIQPMTPKDLLPFDSKPIEPIPVQPAQVPDDEPYMGGGGVAGIFSLIYQWIRAALSSDIINFLEGKQMSNDTKTTVTGIVTGIVSLVAMFGFSVPADVVTIIVAVGVAILGYFTNKKDS